MPAACEETEIPAAGTSQEMRGCRVRVPSVLQHQFSVPNPTKLRSPSSAFCGVQRCCEMILTSRASCCWCCNCDFLLTLLVLCV